jgi:Protein of unknown function (DUF1367)
MESIIMRRDGNKLYPVSQVDEEALEEIPQGKDVTVTIARARSNKHHRFFMALLKKICENHPDYKRADQLLLWLKVRLGYVEEIRFHGDQVWWVAKSISFNSMGQDDFQKFFDASMDVISAEVIPGINQYELLHEVEQMLGFNITDLWSKDNG